MYRIDIKYTGKYGEVDPVSGDPVIRVYPDPDSPGTYWYSWIVYYAQLNDNEINGTLTEVWNGISTFVFNVYYGSNNWDVFFPARTAIRLWSDIEQSYIFQGRVLSVTNNMDSDGKLYKTITCESELSYLCDSICDMLEVQKRLTELGRSKNARDVLVTMLEMHHNAVEGIAGELKKGFFVPGAMFDDETGVFSNYTNAYPTLDMTNALTGDVNTTFALIQDLFVDTLGMDIWVTYNPDAVEPGGDETWTWGYLVLKMANSPVGHTSPTGLGEHITISTNMASLKLETSPTADGTITRIVPLGGIGANGQRLDVSSIPQYHEGWTDPSYDRAIANELLSITYGKVDKVTLHEDLVDDGNKTPAEISAMINELYRRGKAEADALSVGVANITVNAIDLYEAGYDNTKKFTVGDVHRIINDFFGLNDVFRLVKKTTNLAEPWNAKLEFAKRQVSSASISAKKSANTTNRVYNVENMISTRLDKSAVKLTTAAAYEALPTVNANTVYYADQGDGTVKAYLGDKPIGGDGGGVQVTSAAILTNTTVADFVITQETMIDYSPATRVLYGAAPAFFICQENYMMLASSWTNTEKALAVANEQYFSDAVHYTGYYFYNNIVHRVEEYFYSYIEQRTWSTSGKGERVNRKRHRIDYSYPNNDPSEVPTLYSESTGGIIAENPKVIKDVGNNSSTLTNYTSDMFMLSRTETIVNKNTLDPVLQAFFPENVDYACHLYTDNGYYNNGWGWVQSVRDEVSSTVSQAIIFPFKNRAEQDFAMGVIQRTEPVEVSP